ncbi:MAG: NGG1p interacting factor [Sediminibacterium sp.]|nr:NGG1p interacting factor [Sediminibacterium sp.]
MSDQSRTNVPQTIWQRREFVNTISTLGASALLMVPGSGIASDLFLPKQNMTAQQVIDLILKSIPGAPFKQTVDTIKSGDPNQPVKGIVTTMFATVDVIEKTAKAGANFIIAHEPTFYNHQDDTKWLENDEVYKYKAALLEKHKIVVWRFHDYIHAHKPDGVMAGLLTALGWEKGVDPQKPYLLTIPSTSLGSIIDLTKKKLNIAHLRYIGDKNQSCSRISFIPGAAGGKTQMNAIATEKPDLLIIGELEEWETSEYVRDLRASGAKTSLLVLGHIVSEEPGLEWLMTWLQPQIPSIKVTHISSGDAFSWA